MARLASAKDLDKLRKELVAKRAAEKTTVTVCAGTGCLAYKSDRIVAALEKEIEKSGLAGKVNVRRTGCHGFCQRGPIVVVLPKEICYLGMKIEDVPEVVKETLVNGKTVERLLFEDKETKTRILKTDDIPFYKGQKRVIIGNNKLVDPKRIDDYITVDGYAALAKALFKMKPEEVLEEVKKSNLRGRGGGGFPTGWKWQSTRDAAEKEKFVIVNATGSAPGAYMEGNPHSVLEGLIIGAYAIGAHQGFIYVRHEYPLVVENFALALEQTREYGLLGKNIMGSGFDFDVTMHYGVGTFVSGESSALMTALEGCVGEPRPKYVHNSVKGISDKPSCLNNVETWANVPPIIVNGADWFTKMGTENSKGTKVFSLGGKVNNTGFVEVPMGVTLRKLIFEIGGGIPNGKKFKAVQTGGPSGGCLPEKFLDLPVDFDELAKAGSIMGSGGVIVADEDTCMVDFARYYVQFLARESCGKCIPCRQGLMNMLRILNNITSGKGTEADLKTLDDLSEVMQVACLCALGQTAPNPVASTLKHFRDEYMAHVKEKRCPSRACRQLVTFSIDAKKCKGCGSCAKACPTKAISGEKKAVHVVDQAKCVKCGSCIDACPPKFSAVMKTSGGK